MKKQPLAVIGLLIVAVFVLAAVFPQMFTPYNPKQMFEQWQKPSSEHILGTNDMGYDIFAEIVYGTADTLLIGVLSALLSLLFGTFWGIVAAKNNLFGRVADGVINLFAMLPKLICIIVLATFCGNSVWMRIVLIAGLSWVGTARAVRAKAVTINEAVYTKNFEVNGYGKIHVALKHTLPNLWDVVLARFFIGITSAIITEASLGFLGIGDLYNPTWGTMLNLAIKRGAFFHKAYNWLLAPCVCIALPTISFYLISLCLQKEEK